VRPDQQRLDTGSVPVRPDQQTKIPDAGFALAGPDEPSPGLVHLEPPTKPKIPVAGSVPVHQDWQKPGSTKLEPFAKRRIPDTVGGLLAEAANFPLPVHSPERKEPTARGPVKQPPPAVHARKHGASEAHPALGSAASEAHPALGSAKDLLSQVLADAAHRNPDSACSDPIVAVA
jgi:hypothetical protein